MDLKPPKAVKSGERSVKNPLGCRSNQHVIELREWRSGADQDKKTGLVRGVL
jgi:hypothetical protein